MARDFQRPFTLPDGATEVVLVRHGSAPHVTGEPWTEDGQADPNLTELGRLQATAVGRRLQRIELGGLFVTPLRRTHQTAAPLAGALALTPTALDELREIRLGEWEGQLQAKVSAQDDLIAELFRVGRWDVVPGAERMEDFSARIAAGIGRVADAGGASRRALAVVHGGVIAEACCRATGSHPFAFLRPENGSITRLMRLASGRWELISYNDTTHLEDLAVPTAGDPGAPGELAASSADPGRS